MNTSFINEAITSAQVRWAGVNLTTTAMRETTAHFPKFIFIFVLNVRHSKHSSGSTEGKGALARKWVPVHLL